MLHRIRTTGAACLALLVLGLIAYWPGLHGGFIFDDFPNLVADPDWKVRTLDLVEWRRAVFNGISSSVGRPLAMLSFALNHYFTGLDPVWLKATNLAIHLGNALLVFFLCVRVFALAGASSDQRRIGRFAAFIVAAAWAVHPLQVSSVLYVVQRMELGAQGFVLLALLAYLKGRERQIAGHRSWPWLAATAVATLAGLGFKESALLVPGYAFLLELCVLRFRGAGGQRSRLWMGAYAAGITVAAIGFFGVLLPHYLEPRMYAYRDFSLVERLLTQGPVLLTYLGQILLPSPDRLVFYYDNYPISRGLLDPPWTLTAFALLGALLAIAALAWRRWPLVTLGIGWFFLSHALTSNVVPLELAFEHRNYLALLGVLIALAPPLAWLCRNLNTDARVSLASLPVLALLALCLIQSHTWGDPMRLAVALSTRNIESPRASYELGKLLLEDARSDVNAPSWSMARREFEHAASLPDSSPMAEQALIIMDGRTDQPIPSARWESFRAKLARRQAGPHELSALRGVVVCRVQKKCKLDDQQLLDTFGVALQRNPRSGRIHAEYANFAYNVLGDRALAVRVMRDAVRLEPDEPALQIGLAKFLLASSLHSSSPGEVERLIADVQSSNRDGRWDNDLRELQQLRSASTTDRQRNQSLVPAGGGGK